jgi:hypothetical protein
MKEVDLEITILENGEMKIVPKGTAGKECLDIMAFLDKIPGVTVKETTPNKDMNKINSQTAVQIQNRRK